MRCPECGSEGRFKIECTTIAMWNSDEDVEAGDLEYGADSYAECYSCGHDGIVESFS